MTAVIGVTSCRKNLGLYSYNVVGNHYVEAAAYAGIPLILPVKNQVSDIDLILSKLDGLLFTGSPSNVEPHHYQGSPSKEGTLHDPYRDQLTLPLIRKAVEKGVPILCICRGFQEFNVAFGGSLHQRLNELPNMFAHKEPDGDDLELKYSLRHEVEIKNDGLLRHLELPTKFMVNSLHNQGIDVLAPDLVAEAHAPDGLVEAVTMKNAPGFNLGVQWHPEWKFQENPQSFIIFTAFKNACNEYATSKKL